MPSPYVATLPPTHTRSSRFNYTRGVAKTYELVCIHLSIFRTRIREIKKFVIVLRLNFECCLYPLIYHIEHPVNFKTIRDIVNAVMLLYSGLISRTYTCKSASTEFFNFREQTLSNQVVIPVQVAMCHRHDTSGVSNRS